MFVNCKALTALPTLLAENTSDNSCNAMFNGCTSLTTIPNNYLPATVMNTNCYRSMFKGCTGLTTVPSNLLPATTLAPYCYDSMF